MSDDIYFPTTDEIKIKIIWHKKFIKTKYHKGFPAGRQIQAIKNNRHLNRKTAVPAGHNRVPPASANR
jgi:hypothetical protein